MLQRLGCDRKTARSIHRLRRPPRPSPSRSKFQCTAGDKSRYAQCDPFDLFRVVEHTVPFRGDSFMDACCSSSTKSEGLICVKNTIVGFEIWRCELPTGRVIGDCTCHYE